MKLKSFKIIFLFIQIIECYYVTLDETQFHFVKSYLCRYGYLNENLCRQHAVDSLKFMQNNARDMHRAIVMFQTMFNLPKSGNIDEQTMIQMQKARCGNKDFNIKFDSRSEIFNYNRNNFSKLRKNYQNLAYTIRKKDSGLFSESLPNEIVESAVEKSLQAWFSHLNTKVKPYKVGSLNPPDITIVFTKGNHDDLMIFDGLDGEIAHSFPLNDYETLFRGHIHLDDEEDWSENKLMSVLMHEIGHLLGLDHSISNNSIMSPLMFNKNKPITSDITNLKQILGISFKNSEMQSSGSTTTTTKESFIKIGTFKLATAKFDLFRNSSSDLDEENDDLDSNEILKLLLLKSKLINKNSGSSSTIKSLIQLDEKPKLCNLTKIDAICRTESGGSFIFAGDYVWHLTGLIKWRLIDQEGWPKKISLVFPFLPNSIDSATFQALTNHYYFTKNELIWKYKKYQSKYFLEDSYPKYLKEEFPLIPFSNVDSALSFSSSVYFFKNNEMWKSNLESNLTSKMPMKTTNAFSWRDTEKNNSIEPLAYLNTDMFLYKFNFHNIPITYESLNIRYFLFDCVRDLI